MAFSVGAVEIKARETKRRESWKALDLCYRFFLLSNFFSWLASVSHFQRAAKAKNSGLVHTDFVHFPGKALSSKSKLLLLLLWFATTKDQAQEYLNNTFLALPLVTFLRLLREEKYH
jgi:hypothetical protein